MFTTPCFIRKNTPELRARLEELGYEKQSNADIDDPELIITAVLPTQPVGTYYLFDNTDAIDNASIESIDTGTNEALFFALAALRADSDVGQWVIDNGCGFRTTWRICGGDHCNQHEHKATPAELIEHFKAKNNG